jgi:hypothetical protein
MTSPATLLPDYVTPDDLAAHFGVGDGLFEKRRGKSVLAVSWVKRWFTYSTM